MPNMIKILLKCEGFKYDKSLKLNIVCYHIWIREYTSNLCNIVILWDNSVTNHCQWDSVTYQKVYRINK